MHHASSSSSAFSWSSSFGLLHGLVRQK